MHNIRETLWLPAAVLAVGIALTLAILTAADRAAPVGVGSSAYPTPCLYLPVIKQASGAPTPAHIEEDAMPASSAPNAYPPPGLCDLFIPMRTYLPIVRR